MGSGSGSALDSAVGSALASGVVSDFDSAVGSAADSAAGTFSLVGSGSAVTLGSAADFGSGVGLDGSDTGSVVEKSEYLNIRKSNSEVYLLFSDAGSGSAEDPLVGSAVTSLVGSGVEFEGSGSGSTITILEKLSSYSKFLNPPEE